MGSLFCGQKNRKLLAGMARICYIITNGNRFDWFMGTVVLYRRYFTWEKRDLLI